MTTSPTRFARQSRALLFFVVLAAQAMSQTVTWVTQPSATTAEISGSAQFSFTVRSTTTSANFSVQVQKAGSGNASSRFSIVSQSVGTYITSSGNYSEGSYTVQISNVASSDAGSYTFQIGVNGFVASPASQAVVLTVVTALPPQITRQPSNASVLAGGTATFSVTATGQSLSYSWRRNGTAIAGATGSTLTIQNVQSGDAGTYSVVVSNPGGTATSTSATLSITPPVLPSFQVQPVNVSATEGDSVTFSVSVTGTPAPSVVWRKDGRDIVGATTTTLRLNAVALSDTGPYTVVATNAAGSVTSNAAILTVTPRLRPGRLINLSILTAISVPGETFTLGYVVGGAGTSGPKPLVIRAAGPSLGSLGVPGTLDDPKIELFTGTTKTGENDNWGGGAELTAALASVGAFAYNGPNSRDSAALASITTRDNSVKVSASNGMSTGTVIAEVYDATPSGGFSASTPRLLNVSVAKNVGQRITAGFVIRGETPATILVRAVGPGLAAFGVAGVIQDPQLSLFGSGVRIASNDDWGGTPQLSSAATAVGAFGLPATSKDAVLLATLAPGNYTAEATVATGPNGLALVEVYEVP